MGKVLYVSSAMDVGMLMQNSTSRMIEMNKRTLTVHEYAVVEVSRQCTGIGRYAKNRLNVVVFTG